MPERHVVSVTDEIDLVAVHHAAPTDDWLIFCHGLRSDKSGSYEGRSERAVEEGYNAVRFDFRGCGEADGEFSESHLSARIADLEAVLSHFDPPSYVLFGSSFGGAVAFHVGASDDRVEAVGTRAPVTYTDAFGGGTSADGLDAAFAEDVASYDFEADVADRLSVPVAIVHGSADESVPVEHSYRAAEALSTDVLLHTYAGEGHLFSRAAEARLRDLFFSWLDGY